MIQPNTNLKPIQTEQQLLGSLLLSSGTKLVLVDDVLNLNSFSNEYHKNIFKWISTRVSENKPADSVSLVETVGMNTIKQFGGVA